MARKASKTDKDAPDTITIKKYANRSQRQRLCHSGRSSDHGAGGSNSLCTMPRPTKTSHGRFWQIIVEQEAKGNNLLPTGFAALISFYGDNLQGVVPQYLI